MNPNVDYLRYSPQEETSWNFTVPMDATSTDELLQESLGLLDSCYSAYSDFISPRKIEFQIKGTAVDRSLEDLSVDKNHEPNRIQVTLESVGAEVTSNQIRKVANSFDGDDFVYKTLPFIHFTNPKVRVSLAEEERLIGVGSDLYIGPEGSSEVSSPPLEVTIRHYCFGDDFSHSVTVSLGTDIWFEESDIGRENRKRLRSFLQRLSDSIDATEVDFWSQTRSLAFELDWDPDTDH